MFFLESGYWPFSAPGGRFGTANSLFFAPSHETKIPSRRWCRNQPTEVSMWLNIWTVTVAMAIGFAVMAMTVLPKDHRATLGR
jgi:hypothetical protein